jgi:hypothetical protein
MATMLSSSGWDEPRHGYATTLRSWETNVVMPMSPEVPSTRKESSGSSMIFSRGICEIEEGQRRRRRRNDPTTDEHPVSTVTGALGNEIMTKNSGAGD